MHVSLCLLLCPIQTNRAEAMEDCSNLWLQPYLDDPRYLIRFVFMIYPTKVCASVSVSLSVSVGVCVCVCVCVCV
jgi:hypothetical protein